jgi:uncharacterized protein (TIGR02284 family)
VAVWHLTSWWNFASTTAYWSNYLGLCKLSDPGQTHIVLGPTTIPFLVYTQTIPPSVRCRTENFAQSRSRAQFVGELQPEVRSLGGDPENTGSAAGALHRGWIDLKSALGGGDHAILAATKTGEDYAVKEYKRALDETLPAPVRDIVGRQFQSVKQVHDKVKGMRDRLDK